MKHLALGLFSILTIMGTNTLAGQRAEPCIALPAARQIVSPSSRFNQWTEVFDFELEVVWIRLPQPIKQVQDFSSGAQQVIRQLNPLSVSTHVTISVDPNVFVTAPADLYEGWSNPLSESIKLKIPTNVILSTPQGPAINLTLKVDDEVKVLFQSNISLPLSGDFLQRQRKQFIGSPITEIFDLKNHPSVFPIRLGASEIVPLFKGNHDDGTFVVVVTRKIRNPQLMNDHAAALPLGTLASIPGEPAFIVKYVKAAAGLVFGQAGDNDVIRDLNFVEPLGTSLPPLSRSRKCRGSR